jgi:hypothetical protein
MLLMALMALKQEEHSKNTMKNLTTLTPITLFLKLIQGRILNEIPSLNRAEQRKNTLPHKKRDKHTEQATPSDNLPFRTLDNIVNSLKHEGRIREVSRDKYKAVKQIKLKKKK